MKPEHIENRQIYQGKIFDVSLATVREENITYDREIVSHNGSAVIVPVFADKTVALVKQYRHAAGKYLLEIPAGSLKKDEDPQLGAERELEEEIGVKAGKIEKLTEFYVSPGFLTEKMHVFLATQLTEVGQNLEEDELLSIERHDFPTLFQMISRGEFEDAKTMVGLILAGARFGFAFSK
ncbi:MAG TPA: NUDIX hydrolase [Pyrinomonadaceae bacterium]|jgi:ADP-ribose pyrophosphatase